MRTKFVEYARDNLSHLRVFLAENAYKDLISNQRSGFRNVAEFEDIIAGISDCTIIFPESPGSFSEVGYFAKNEKIRKKLLIVNNLSLQARDSFLSLLAR